VGKKNKKKNKKKEKNKYKRFSRVELEEKRNINLLKNGV